jgi:hypothetical protein
MYEDEDWIGMFIDGIGKKEIGWIDEQQVKYKK